MLLSPENPYLKVAQSITKNPMTQAPKVLELLGELPIKTKNKKEQYYSVINYAITTFESALINEHSNSLSTLKLTEIITQCEKMIATIDQIKMITSKVFVSKRTQESKIEILNEYQKAFSNQISVFKKKIKAREIEAMQAHEEAEQTREKLNKMMTEFNPSVINDIPSQLQSEIARINQESEKAAQEALVKNLLNKINDFLNEKKVQPKPEHAPVFRETLDLMENSLDDMIRKISPHPFSKMMKSYADTKHKISKLTMTITATFQFEIEPQIQSTPESSDGEFMNVNPTHASEKASQTPEAISKSESSDVVIEFYLRRSRINVPFDQINTMRNQALISVIKAFENCLIETENKKTETLENELDAYIFNLDSTPENASQALRGLNQYKQYLLDNKRDHEAIFDYTVQLSRDLIDVRYGDHLVKKILGITSQQSSLFSKPAPAKEIKPVVSQAKPLPVFLSRREEKHQARERQENMRDRDRSPVRKKR